MHKDKSQFMQIFLGLLRSQDVQYNFFTSEGLGVNIFSDSRLELKFFLALCTPWIWAHEQLPPPADIKNGPGSGETPIFSMSPMREIRWVLC